MAIAIVGTGIAGLHLALRLQQSGIDTELYGEKTPEQIRSGTMFNTVARFGRTRSREAALGLPALPALTSAVRFTIHTNPQLGNPSLSFRGVVDEPWSFVDMRTVSADALETYTARGGSYRIGLLTIEDIAALGDNHDLVVVATGRRGIDELFPVDPNRSPHTQPQRQLAAMFVDGLQTLPDADFGYHVVPGVGELFQPTFVSAAGNTAGLLFEGVPGAPFAELSAMDYGADPAAFNARALSLLNEFTPEVAALADPATFGVRGPLDVLRGALRPCVRTASVALQSGTYALAVGDAWITNDPVTGQGANTASHCAGVAAEAIIGGGPYDADFCQRVENAMWDYAGPVTEWTNAVLGPPPDHVLGVFVAAAQNQQVADALIANFNDPPAMWNALQSPPDAEAFLAGV